jgi:hypothetical protein
LYFGVPYCGIICQAARRCEMPLGLTNDELIMTFINSFNARLTEWQGNLQAVLAGESPEFKNFLDNLHEKVPGVNTEQAIIVAALLAAFMDTIASNNDALSKVIPHVES